jgi:hypothetical protein
MGQCDQHNQAPPSFPDNGQHQQKQNGDIVQPLKEQEKTQLWLDQFGSPADRLLAEKLLDSISYCPLNEFKNSLTKLIKNTLPSKTTSALFIERELQKTRAKLPPPIYESKKTYNPRSKKKHLRAQGAAIQAIKSLKYTSQDIGSETLTTHVATTLCRSNGARFLLQPTANNVRDSKVRNFVILTDFIGSGDRAFAMLDAMWNVPSIRSWHSGRFIKFWVMAYSGTGQGIRKVETHRFAPTVAVVTDCPTLHNSFDADLEDMKSLCKKYGAHSDNPLGWKNTAALLAFEHGAPNNMPAIFISEKNRGKRRWAPLFPKRVTDVLRQSAQLTQTNMDVLFSTALNSLQAIEIAQSPRFKRSNDQSKSAIIVLLAHSQGKRRIAELRRILPLSLDTLIHATDRAVRRGWLTNSGALTLAGHKAIRFLRRQGKKFFVAPAALAPYYPTQLRAPQ